MTTKAVYLDHPLAGRVSHYQDGEDMMYVMDSFASTFGCFPCVFLLHDFDGHDVAAYVLIGNAIVYDTTDTWRTAIASGNGGKRTVFGPYPDLDTAVLTCKLVHENEVARLLEQSEKE